MNILAIRCNKAGVSSRCRSRQEWFYRFPENRLFSWFRWESARQDLLSVRSTCSWYRRCQCSLCFSCHICEKPSWYRSSTLFRRVCSSLFSWTLRTRCLLLLCHRTKRLYRRLSHEWRWSLLSAKWELCLWARESLCLPSRSYRKLLWSEWRPSIKYPSRHTC